MENLKCPQCGNALANGVAVCGSCGREVKEDEIDLPSDDQEKEPGKKNLYAFLQQHGMSLAGFEKQIEKDLLISKLFAKGLKEKGLTKDVWYAELQKRAKVEILTK
jgi:predicted amidophosphoribosyltransferase